MKKLCSPSTIPGSVTMKKPSASSRIRSPTSRRPARCWSSPPARQNITECASDRNSDVEPGEDAPPGSDRIQVEIISGATGPYAASPIPTKQRVRRRTTKVPASPDAPLARLQRITPAPTMNHLDFFSATRANTGAPIMYISMNAVPSRPRRASSGLNPRRI